MSRLRLGLGLGHAGPHVVGRLELGPLVVGRLWSGVWVSVSFKIFALTSVGNYYYYYYYN